MITPTAVATPKPPRVNLRRPDVMEAVREQVEAHYRSQIVEKLRHRGGVLEAGGLQVRLAKEFGFCYGVERAIDLAYAARRAYEGRRIFLLGEIIHNPDVNAQMRTLQPQHVEDGPGCVRRGVFSTRSGHASRPNDESRSVQRQFAVGDLEDADAFNVGRRARKVLVDQRARQVVDNHVLSTTSGAQSAN